MGNVGRALVEHGHYIGRVWALHRQSMGITQTEHEQSMGKAWATQATWAEHWFEDGKVQSMGRAQYREKIVKGDNYHYISKTAIAQLIKHSTNKIGGSSLATAL